MRLCNTGSVKIVSINFDTSSKPQEGMYWFVSQRNSKAKVQKETKQLHEEIFCGGIVTSKTLNTD